MDPTMPMSPQGAAPTDPQAAKNAMMLQAIKAGALGGMGQVPTSQASNLGQAPMAQQPIPPVNPGSLPGTGQQQLSGLGQIPQSEISMMQQQNPVASALMSPIPGGQ